MLNVECRTFSIQHYIIEEAMMLDITLPPLPGGAALVLRWLAGPGATIGAGAPLLIVRTEVAEVALPAPEAGELVEILADAGQRAATGQALAHLRPIGHQDRLALARVTPLARQIALAHSIHLALLSGSGADGRVVAQDVRHIVGAQQSHADVREDNRITAATAAPLQIPIASAVVEFDAGAALALCAAQGASLRACVATAAVGLLPRYRALNASWSDDGLLLRRRVNLAVATPAGEGLTWSLIRDAGDLSLHGVARAMRTDADPINLGEATFALVSLSSGSLWHCAPPPLVGTVAALGLGAPRRQAVVCGDAIAVRPVAALTLSYDARAFDHTQATSFLRDLRDALER
jgi:pyruvate/2-oxoglutarate dehydrogenase complex dihydrolipoamide acyltransferase (E2) component